MGLFRTILGGLDRAFSSRSDRRAATDDANLKGEWGLRNTNARGNQDRESLLYTMQLNEWQRQQERKERGRGGANYAQFGKMPSTYTNKAPFNTTPEAMPNPRTVSYDGR